MYIRDDGVFVWDSSTSLQLLMYPRDGGVFVWGFLNIIATAKTYLRDRGVFVWGSITTLQLLKCISGTEVSLFRVP